MNTREFGYLAGYLRGAMRKAAADNPITGASQVASVGKDLTGLLRSAGSAAAKPGFLPTGVGGWMLPATMAANAAQNMFVNPEGQMSTDVAGNVAGNAKATIKRIGGNPLRGAWEGAKNPFGTLAGYGKAYGETAGAMVAAAKDALFANRRGVAASRRALAKQSSKPAAADLIQALKRQMKSGGRFTGSRRGSTSAIPTNISSGAMGV